MTFRRALVVSLVLALAAPGFAGPPPATVALDGRPYIDVATLATHLDARMERTAERVYLHTKGHVITLTRGWARVEVDGKAVVLEAPVRVVEQGRWLVPEAFMRQVMPILAGGPPAAPTAPPRAAPAKGPAAPAPAALAPPAAAAEPSKSGPPPAGRASEAPAESQASADSTRPLPPTPLARLVDAQPAPPASPPVGTVPAPPALAPTRALDAPKGAPRTLIMESPTATNPTVTKGVEPGKSGPTTVDPGKVGPIAAVEPPKVAPPPASPAIKGAAVGATLEDVRLRSYPAFTRVVVETSAIVRSKVEAVTPKELRIRLASVSATRRTEEVRDGILESVHVEPAEGDAVVRVTFTGSSQEPKTSMLSDPPRLLFDFPRAPEAAARSPLSAPGPLRTLVLDAGHGGHDAGAIGPGGLMEKDLVLDVTRRVAALVEAYLPGIKVLQSRKGDTLVPLRDRTSYANRERADLFVSIHANAHRENTSEGVETYFLSTEATDGVARQVAAAENSVVKLEKPAARGSRADVVKAILWDLAQSEFQQESSRLAEVVQDSMTQSLKIPNRGVKQAGFYVLGGAAMPAILVEIGFVTNPREERRLKESAYRDEIARAIFAGISGYKQDLDRRAARAVSR